MSKPAKAAPSPSQFETIERLKSYTEFESVTVGADGSVSVKYASRVPVKAPSAPPLSVRESAIDSLKRVAPPFLPKS